MNVIDSLWNKLVIKKKQVKTGKNFSVYGKIYIHGIPGRIKIGDDVTFISDPNSNPTGGGEHIHLRVEGSGQIIIGNHVGITRVEMASYNSITIEDYVLLGGNVKIWDTDFHSIYFDYRMEALDTHVKTAPVTICKGAFVGANSIILKGVKIGEKSIIGAGSVVTKDVPSGEVWAGNPAKFVKLVGDV